MAWRVKLWEEDLPGLAASRASAASLARAFGRRGNNVNTGLLRVTSEQRVRIGATADDTVECHNLGIGHGVCYRGEVAKDELRVACTVRCSDLAPRDLQTGRRCLYDGRADHTGIGESALMTRVPAPTSVCPNTEPPKELNQL